MRIYTVLVSVGLHLVVIGAAVVVPTLASDALPEPARRDAIVYVRPEPPAHVPYAPAPHTHRAVGAPLEPPLMIAPEAAREPALDSAFEALTGIAPDLSPGSVVFGGDPLPPPRPPPPPAEPLRVGGRIEAPQKVRHVAPAYPPLAMAARIGGVVILEAAIDEAGTVHDVRVLRSIPFLDQAAIDAVKQWRFTPTRLNGQAVPVVMTITVDFRVPG